MSKNTSYSLPDKDENQGDVVLPCFDDLLAATVLFFENLSEEMRPVIEAWVDWYENLPPETMQELQDLGQEFERINVKNGSVGS